MKMEMQQMIGILLARLGANHKEMMVKIDAETKAI
jgi:hypothetical protein